MRGDDNPRGGPANLTPISDISELVRSPRDRYLVRRSFCFWQIGTSFKGVIAWGVPQADDAREMVRAFDLGARKDRHVSLVDMRAVRAVDPVAFDVVSRYIAERQPTFERTVRRQALLHGEGVVGAAVAGFYRVIEPRYPVLAFRDERRAIAWLEVDNPDLVVSTLRWLRGQLLDVPDVVARVVTALASGDPSGSLLDVARRMGLSTRSLQRALAAAGTSFRQEAHRYRMARARELLAASKMPVKAVAGAIGLSPDRLSAAFRAEVGLPPDEWRRQLGLNGKRALH
jgi:AraC-like DNA-binding protein